MNDQQNEPIQPQIQPLGPNRSHNFSIHYVVGEIERQNRDSMKSKDLPVTEVKASIDRSPREADPVNEDHGPSALEQIAQKIFDQDVHDLAFEESEANDDSERRERHRSFVEVSHFSIGRFEVEDEKPAVQEEVAVQAAPIAEPEPEVSEPVVELTPHQNMLQNLCDAELIAEIESIPQRLSFKIGEVADLLKIKPFVLRYWETEFDVLKPKKAQNKQRVYHRREVENAFLIRKLLHRDRFSIEGARNALKMARQSLKNHLEQKKAQDKLERDEKRREQEMKKAAAVETAAQIAPAPVAEHEVPAMQSLVQAVVEPIIEKIVDAVEAETQASHVAAGLEAADAVDLAEEEIAICMIPDESAYELDAQSDSESAAVAEAAGALENEEQLEMTFAMVDGPVFGTIAEPEVESSTTTETSAQKNLSDEPVVSAIPELYKDFWTSGRTSRPDFPPATPEAISDSDAEVDGEAELNEDLESASDLEVTRAADAAESLDSTEAAESSETAEAAASSEVAKSPEVAEAVAESDSATTEFFIDVPLEMFGSEELELLIDDETEISFEEEATEKDDDVLAATEESAGPVDAPTDEAVETAPIEAAMDEVADVGHFTEPTMDEVAEVADSSGEANVAAMEMSAEVSPDLLGMAPGEAQVEIEALSIDAGDDAEVTEPDVDAEEDERAELMMSQQAELIAELKVRLEKIRAMTRDLRSLVQYEAK